MKRAGESYLCCKGAVWLISQSLSLEFIDGVNIFLTLLWYPFTQLISFVVNKDWSINNLSNGAIVMVLKVIVPFDNFDRIKFSILMP